LTHVIVIVILMLPALGGAAATLALRLPLEAANTLRAPPSPSSSGLLSVTLKWLGVGVRSAVAACLLVACVASLSA